MRCITICLFSLVAGGSLISWAHPTRKIENLFNTAQQNNSLSMFNTLIVEAGYKETIQYRGPFTLLIPTDEAFGELDADEMDTMMDDPVKLQNFLKRHIIREKIELKTMLENKSITTASGHKLSVSSIEKITVGGAKLKVRDIRCTNGYINIITKILPL